LFVDLINRIEIKISKLHFPTIKRVVKHQIIYEENIHENGQLILPKATNMTTSIG